MNTPKEDYRALCEVEPTIPVFSRAWWLDAVAGENDWDVVVVKRGPEIVASMPYVKIGKLGFTLLGHPPLTQTLGPWLKLFKDSPARRIKQQHDLMQSLIEQLPPFDSFYQRWHYANTDWLPFYWAGFKQTTRYTYVIEDLSDPDAVAAGFSHGKRMSIKKAKEKIKIKFDIPAQTFYEHHKMTLGQVNLKIGYPYEVFARMYKSGYEHNAACTIAAYDEHDNLHAAFFIVWDENSAYALINTIDHDFRSSGATSLLTREIIRHVSNKTKRFDFEGSMIKGVESSVREFNARQTRYFSISKTSSRLYAAARFLRSLVTEFKQT